jgi:hypothetical protein
MNDIIEPTIDYDFSTLYLGPPSTIAGGAYFTRIMYKNNKQLFIQTPKGLTKQGFVKSGKKIYADLMFDNNDTVFINWIENLETKCQELIFSKGENWFQTKLEKDDIESAFTSPFKIYKSGKFYLLRVNVKPNVKVYNDSDGLINLDDITADKTLISIIEIQGIKFSSRNFQIEIELKQSMVVSPDPFLDVCFIKKPIKTNNKNNKNNTNDNDDNDDNENDDIDNDTTLNHIVMTNKQENILKTEDKNKIDESKINNSIQDIPFDDSFSKNSVLSNPNERSAQIKDISHLDTNARSEKTYENNNDEHDEDNIILEIEDLDIPETQEDPNSLKEVDLSLSLENNLESMTLKNPNQVYYEIYKKARDKAKEAKKAAILAFLEAKNIKKTYMLDNIDDSEESDEDFSINDDSL